MILLTLPVCPRCEMIKAKLAKAGKVFEIKNADQLDEETLNKYANLFWPLLLIENREEPLQFAEILEFIKKE